MKNLHMSLEEINSEIEKLAIPAQFFTDPTFPAEVWSKCNTEKLNRYYTLVTMKTFMEDGIPCSYEEAAKWNSI